MSPSTNPADERKMILALHWSAHERGAPEAFPAHGPDAGADSRLAGNSSLVALLRPLARLSLALLAVLQLGTEPVLWYAQPARERSEALPVGNGRLGGMVFGRVQNERIQLKEDTVWAGSPEERVIPRAYQHLPGLRPMLFAGEYVAAERKIEESIMSERIFPKGYQPLGSSGLTRLHRRAPEGPLRRRRDARRGCLWRGAAARRERRRGSGQSLRPQVT